MAITLGPLASENAAAARLAPLYNATPLTVASAEAGRGTVGTLFTGLAFDGHAADPTIAREPGGDVHMYVSNNFDYSTVAPMGGEVLRVPLLTSKDGVNFVPRGDALAAWPDWMERTPDSAWAPFVSAPKEPGGEWRMYLTGLVKDTKPATRPEGVPNDTATAMIEGNGKRGIGLMTSTDGITFTPKGGPLVVSKDVFDGIDPFVHQVDGNDYLYWGSSGHPIRAQQLAADGASLVGQPIEVAVPDAHANAGYMKLIEGAEPVPNPDGSWSLIVSGDDTLRDHYNVMELRGDNPLGPFRPMDRGRLVIEKPGVRSGPGHHETMVDDAGQRWMYLHAYDHDEVTGTDLATRKLHLLRLDWEQDGRWHAHVPTDGRGPVINAARGAAIAAQ